jgi:hypothetical protein
MISNVDNRLAQVFVVVLSVFLVGSAVYMVLDGAEKAPDRDLNASASNDKVCVPPYRDGACYPVNDSVNASLPANHTSNQTNTSQQANQTVNITENVSTVQ